MNDKYNINSEQNMFYTLEEALAECKKRNIDSLESFKILPKIFTSIHRSDRDNDSAYDNELERILKNE